MIGVAECFFWGAGEGEGVEGTVSNALGKNGRGLLTKDDPNE